MLSNSLSFSYWIVISFILLVNIVLSNFTFSFAISSSMILLFNLSISFTLELFVVLFMLDSIIFVNSIFLFLSSDKFWVWSVIFVLRFRICDSSVIILWDNDCISESFFVKKHLSSIYLCLITEQLNLTYQFDCFFLVLKILM